MNFDMFCEADDLARISNLKFITVQIVELYRQFVYTSTPSTPYKDLSIVNNLPDKSHISDVASPLVLNILNREPSVFESPHTIDFDNDIDEENVSDYTNYQQDDSDSNYVYSDVNSDDIHSYEELQRPLSNVTAYSPNSNSNTLDTISNVNKIKYSKNDTLTFDPEEISSTTTNTTFRHKNCFSSESDIKTPSKNSLLMVPLRSVSNTNTPQKKNIDGDKYFIQINKLAVSHMSKQKQFKRTSSASNIKSQSTPTPKKQNINNNSKNIKTPNNVMKESDQPLKYSLIDYFSPNKQVVIL